MMNRDEILKKIKLAIAEMAKNGIKNRYTYICENFVEREYVIEFLLEYFGSVNISGLHIYLGYFWHHGVPKL